MRREYSAKPSAVRQIYYSEADRRYHLAGASEGWMETGYLVNKQKDLEFRWFDKDGDGRLDTVEVFRPDNPLPVRVSHYNPRARLVDLNRDRLIDEYNKKVLPEAIEEDRTLIDALKKVSSDPTADAYEAEAAKAEMPERARYCLDIARELLFLKVRDKLHERNAASPYPQAAADRTKYKSMDVGSMKGGYSMGDSIRYWQLARKIEQFQDEYVAGKFSQAAKTLEQLAQ